jgi:multidrug efflux pump subunit AcrA (membrane-fusion protein)
MTAGDPKVERNERGRSRKSGAVGWLQRNVWGIATIVVVAIICAIVVKVFKKPGQMTVIESQAMDMSSMLPPAGAVPVAMATVERKTVEGSITYTGTVQAFEDEDVYPRVTGRIVKMPVYPGDRVKKGELLVQLDPTNVSEYKARLEQAKDEADAEMHNASIAKEDFKQKEYEYKAAREEETAADKAVAEAEASLSYWKPETERQRKLYEKEVVSLAEYQQEESYCKASMAKTEGAKAQLRAATDKRIAAEAAFNAMMHHVGHEYLLAKKAKAAELDAALYEQYTRIRAKDDAVITKRLISPGVVVNPGMQILKVAHVGQVRVQVEVSSEHAARVKLGDPVTIKGLGDSPENVEAQVTAIFPAADPTNRTFIVEALINNVREAAPEKAAVSTLKQYYFLPGQYVVMKIVTDRKDGLAIPTNSIIWDEGKAMVWKANGGNSSGKAEYSCLMHPEVVSEKPGECPKCGMKLEPKERGGRRTAELVGIKIGASNPDFTAVTDGLSEGDQVIYAGYENLSPGSAVVAAQWGAAGPVKLPAPAEVTGTRLDSSDNWMLDQTQADLMLHISLAPAPPKSGNNELVIKITKHGGSPVAGARISATTSMPGMNMPGPALNGTTNGSGEARLRSDFSSGAWQGAISVSAPGEKPVETTIDIGVP